MNQESKQLVLKDLCARLPYGVKCSFGVDEAVYEICGINPVCCGASEIQATHIKSGINGDFVINACKPYLFPLSSMTEEQKKEFYKLFEEGITEYKNETKQWLKTKKASKTKRPITIAYVMVHELVVDWLNKNNFDYRGLIEKGLALDATNLGIY